MALTKPHDFVANTSALSSEVNNNFDALFNACGSQEYTEQNYVKNDETFTKSLDALDKQLKDVTDSIAGGAQTYTLYNQQATPPNTFSDILAIFAQEAASEGEAHFYMREESDGSTLKLLTGNAGHKTWVYSNTATPGWIIDTTVTDRVIAIKGGTGSYNVNGGNEAGAWSHEHTVGAHSHSFTGSVTTTGTAASAGSHTHAFAAGLDVGIVNPAWSSTSGADGAHTHTTSATGTATGTTGSGTGNTGTNTSFRPYAAVGTLQYPDMP